MSKTKKITISAMLVALGAAVMVLGAVVEVFDLTACAFASLVIVLVYLELGPPYTWLVWLCTSLVTALIYQGSLISLEYFSVFGLYPLIKAYIERLPKWSWLVTKILYCNAVVWVLFFVSEKLLGIPFFGEEGIVMKVVIYVLLNLAFVMYDIFITVMVRFYLEKLRHRFKGFFK